MSPRTEAGKRLIASYPGNAADASSPEFIRHMVAAIDAIEVAARAQALEEVRAGVETIENTSGGHWDQTWNDATGARDTYHECHGLSRASVLALLDRLSKGTGG